MGEVQGTLPTSRTGRTICYYPYEIRWAYSKKDERLQKRQKIEEKRQGFFDAYWSLASSLQCCVLAVVSENDSVKIKGRKKEEKKEDEDEEDMLYKAEEKER